jgi:hypothetical protein
MTSCSTSPGTRWRCRIFAPKECRPGATTLEAFAGFRDWRAGHPVHRDLSHLHFPELSSNNCRLAPGARICFNSTVPKNAIVTTTKNIFALYGYDLTFTRWGVTMNYGQ